MNSSHWLAERRSHGQSWASRNNRNIIFDIRFAEGKPELLPSLAAELVRTPSDVIVASGSPATEAARGATNTVPIVMVAVGDALAAGFVTNLAHPGGNITGQTHVATEQGAKRLELVKELFLTPDVLAYYGMEAIPVILFNSKKSRGLLRPLA